MEEQKSDQISRPDRSTGDERRHTGNRRRGEILEAAILQAAWDELFDGGYTHLTMEGVAARARTNKAVLYRRWANKAKLVAAAISKHVPRPTGDVPDTGDLRNDVLILLHGIAQPLQIIGAETMHGLMVEYLDKDMISSFPQRMHPGTESRLTTAMMTILKNADTRGEVKLDTISPRVISLPAVLLQYEILTTHEPIADTTIDEIVDDIFLPLVRA
ncbi:TetR/AcrR family transcriptional regulator [Methanosphaerula palustris]|uniref:Transcriptional regulator, TetR family n=1 Tax=Methanosphaerula palustris (strain ATCC BAA-1556 / DSM 19958 / E1-9c) TaxID=521011 RepID=B8GGH6_METPE|nr:TetR/AcrR family transcriptional regulator [Methanosphaerula palustris]ACL16231.1 transcriptional regulator, TetR family [Methanosphaerula palustris E1-9c]